MSDHAFNADMLVSAREEAGLTQGELAEAMGVTQGTVSKVENGQLPPTKEFLEKAAAILGFRSSYFYRRPRHHQLPLTFYRKKAKLPAIALKRIHATVIRKRVDLEDLLRSAEVPKNRVPSIDLKASGRSAADAARDVRIRWNLPRGPIDDLTSELEDRGVVIISLDFGTDLSDGLSTFEPSDGLPPVVFLNNRCPADRARFTLAHELGHIVLHHHLVYPPDECEGEADAFASEFLMPEADIRGFLGRLDLETAAALKQAWKVSIAALVMRAAQLDRISEARKRSLFIELGKRGWRAREPVELPSEEPTVYTELAQFHIEDLQFTEEQLSEVLAMPVERLRAEFFPQRRGGLRLVQ